jgi:hypothetical protein
VEVPGSPIPGDFDCDGDVDLDDYTQFQPCLAGPGGGLGSGCGWCDLDSSSAVDLYDFAVFQEAFEG